MIKKILKHNIYLLPYIFRLINNEFTTHRKSSRAAKPSTIKLILNSNCNCTCNFCDVGAKNKSVFFDQMVNEKDSIMNIETLRALLNEFKFVKPFVSICGVEPLLHPNIIEILKLLRTKEFATTLITNGVLLPKYADDLAKIDIRSLKVSIDGTEEIHDQIRGRGVFKKAVEGLRKYNSAKLKYKTKTKVVINFTISHTNVPCITKVADYFFSEKLIDEMKFNYLFFTTPEAADLQRKLHPGLGRVTAVNYNIEEILETDTDSILEQLNALGKKYGEKIIYNKWLSTKANLDTYYHSPNKPLKHATCIEPWTGATILANGDVVISNRCFEYKTGNIHKQSFSKIWNNKETKLFRDELKKNRHFPACNRCGGIYFS